MDRPCFRSRDIAAADAGSWGADRLVLLEGVDVEEDIALGVAAWIAGAPMPPWAILASSTAHGREVASRVAAAIGAGLTGDAADVEIVDGRLIAWKPAFGGQLVAAVTATSPVQMVTMRSGVVAPSEPRRHFAERPASQCNRAGGSRCTAEAGRTRWSRLPTRTW